MHPKVQNSRETVVLEHMWKSNCKFCTYLFIYGTSRRSQEFGLVSNGIIFLLMMFSKLLFLLITFKHNVHSTYD
jgi:hypothetical protein